MVTGEIIARKWIGFLAILGATLFACLAGLLLMTGHNDGAYQVAVENPKFVKWFGLSHERLIFKGNLAALGALSGVLTFLLRGYLSPVFLKIVFATIQFMRGAPSRLARSMNDLASTSLSRAARILSVNIFVCLCMLFAAELLVRIFIEEPGIYAPRADGEYVAPGQYFAYSPYLMTVNEPSIDARGMFPDRVTGGDIVMHAKTNRLGFRTELEFSTSDKRFKAPDEKVVLIFGGSAVWGFGSTSNDTTIAGYMQDLLNSNNGAKNKYTVINMGNGGFVSYQQFIALNLYGMNLSPDWIILMDGHNDVYGFLTLEETGVHGSASLQRQLIDRNLFRQVYPSLNRPELLDMLIRNSKLARLVLDMRPLHEVTVGEGMVGRPWEDLERALQFYWRTQRSILRECDTCQYIISTQPIQGDKRRVVSPEEWASIESKFSGTEIRFDSMFKDSFSNEIVSYAQSRLINGSRDLCEKFDDRCAAYIPMDREFPEDNEKKKVFFTDGVHLNDDGAQIAAQVFAKQILMTDGSVK